MAFGRNTEPDYLAMILTAACPPWWMAISCCWNSIRSCAISRLSTDRVRRSIPTRRSCVPPSTAGWTGRSPLCSRWTGRVLGAGPHPKEKRDMIAIQKDADAEAVVWRIPDAQLAADNSSKAINSRSPILRSALMRAAGSGRRHQQAAIAQSRTLVRAIFQPSRISEIPRPADELGARHSAAGALEQQNTNDQHQRNHRYRQARGPSCRD